MSIQGLFVERRRGRGGRGLLMAGTAALAIVVADHARADEDWGRRDKWAPHMQLELKPGTDREIGQFELWVPVWQNETTLAYVNPRVQADLDENYEANVGIGVRTQLNDEWILGGYAYFDYRVTEHDNTFLQGSVGAELLSDDWGFRVNGYLPESDSKLVPGVGAFDIGTVTVRHGEERALPGFDAEVEYGFNPFEEMDAELRFYAGGYYFDADGYETHAGPRLRAEMRLFDLDPFPNGSRVVVGAEYQWDDPRGHQAFGLLQVRVPIQGLWGAPERKKKVGIDRRMEESVRRDIDIVVADRLGDPIAASFADGTEIADVIFLNEGGMGDGSSVEEAMDIDDYFAGAPVEDALHVVIGDDGELQSVGNQLLDGQVFIGGGTSYAVQGLENLFVDFDAPGLRPTLHNEGEGTAAIFELANRNDIIGMDFRLTQMAGASGDYVGIAAFAGADDILLQDLRFMNDGTLPDAVDAYFMEAVGAEAIYITGGSNIEIHDIVANDMFGESIHIDSSSMVNMSGIAIDGCGRSCIAWVGSSDITLVDFTILNSGDTALGIYSSSNVTISDGLADTSGVTRPATGTNIVVVGSSDVNFDNITAMNATAAGFLVNTSSNVNIANSMIDTVDSGIIYQESQGTVSDVSIFNASVQGVILRDDGANNTVVELNNVTIDATSPVGLVFGGAGEITVSGTGNTIDSALVCDTVGGPTVFGSVEVNGDPEPGTVCP